jgi:hypothetical protein
MRENWSAIACCLCLMAAEGVIQKTYTSPAAYYFWLRLHAYCQIALGLTAWLGYNAKYVDKYGSQQSYPQLGQVCVIF